MLLRRFHALRNYMAPIRYLVILVIGSLNWPAYYRMTKRGIRGTGTVVQLLPEIHNTVRYEYQVAGRRFEGQMQSWPPNPAVEQLNVG